MLRDGRKSRYLKHKDFVQECYSCGMINSKVWFYNYGTRFCLCVKCYDWLRSVNGYSAKLKLAKNECYACGSKELRDRICNWDRDNNVLCNACYCHLIGNPRNRLRLKYKRIQFKDKQIYLIENPKTGICRLCYRSVLKGEIKRTNIHHIEYDESDPMAHTIELCVNCHNNQHPERYENIIHGVGGKWQSTK